MRPDDLFALPRWLTDIAHQCPYCKAGIAAPSSAAAFVCARCGFRGENIAGVPSFLKGANINEWHSRFEELAKSSGAEGVVGIDVRSSRLHRYLVEGFRRVCGPLDRDASILDVGCGNGMFWQALFCDRRVVGIDFSQRLATLARARGMLVYHADAFALPFGDEQFDLVCSAEVIQCVDDLESFARELARVSRAGGRIILGASNKRSLMRRAMRLVRRVVPHHDAAPKAAVVMRSVDDLVALAPSLSLTVEAILWEHFPLPWFRTGQTPNYVLDPFATNFVVAFRKAGVARG